MNVTRALNTHAFDAILLPFLNIVEIVSLFQIFRCMDYLHIKILFKEYTKEKEESNSF